MKRRKNWHWGQTAESVVKIGEDWTLIAVECYLEKECTYCKYFRYCNQQTVEGKYIMQLVVAKLLEVYGKPSRELIAKAEYYKYN